MNFVILSPNGFCYSQKVTVENVNTVILIDMRKKKQKKTSHQINYQLSMPLLNWTLFINKICQKDKKQVLKSGSLLYRCIAK